MYMSVYSWIEFGHVVICLITLLDEPRKEYVRLFAVRLELGIVFVLVLEQRHSRHEANE